MSKDDSNWYNSTHMKIKIWFKKKKLNKKNKCRFMINVFYLLTWKL